ncbi:hypothetical protein MASR2M74_34370 [Paracoccaceae bacterium]
MAAGFVMSAVLGGFAALGFTAVAAEAGPLMLLTAWSSGGAVAAGGLVAIRLRQRPTPHH